MRLILLFTFPAVVWLIPVVWDFPPLRNVSMPPSIQLILGDGQGLIDLGNEKTDPLPAPTLPTLPGSTSEEFLFSEEDKSFAGGFPFEINFPPSPLYCISFLCIGNLLGYNTSAEIENIPTASIEVETSTSTPVFYASADPKSDSDVTDDSFERLVRAALLLFGSLPGVLLLCFFVLGKFL